MKNKILICTFLVILSFCSCKKKDSDTTPTPNDAPASYKIVFNDTTYKSSDAIKLPDLASFDADTYNPPISGNGSFICFAFDTTYSYSGQKIKLYSLAIYQGNIVNKDTLGAGITITAASPINTGVYNVYGDYNEPNSISNVVYFDDTYAANTYQDSISTGTVSILSIDYTKNIVSGTYSINQTGKKGSTPEKNVITGTFINLPLQNFSK